MSLTANIRPCNVPTPARKRSRATTMFIPAVMPARHARRASSGLASGALAIGPGHGAGCTSPGAGPGTDCGGLAPSAWTRDTLGGDWGGLRSALGQQGLRFDLWAHRLLPGPAGRRGQRRWGLQRPCRPDDQRRHRQARPVAGRRLPHPRHLPGWRPAGLRAAARVAGPHQRSVSAGRQGRSGRDVAVPEPALRRHHPR